MRKFGPWDYQINYDTEIANDTREIEALPVVEAAPRPLTKLLAPESAAKAN